MNRNAKLIAIPAPVSLATDRHAPLVAECLNAEHPTLTGRVEVRWATNGVEQVRWLATLRDLSIRAGDRVLVTAPSNWEEPIIIGVIDGFARRPCPSKHHRETLDLQPDEAVCIRTASGKPLLELTTSDRGAEIRLLEPNAKLEVDGHLAIGAKQITLTAREGEARIEASDDVIVRGENVHLN